MDEVTKAIEFGNLQAFNSAVDKLLTLATETTMPINPTKHGSAT